MSVSQIQTNARRPLLGAACLAPFGLIVIKVVEVLFEATEPTWIAAIGRGIQRRLDDPSFWYVIFIAVGCWRIDGAIRRLRLAGFESRLSLAGRMAVMGAGTTLLILFVIALSVATFLGMDSLLSTDASVPRAPADVVIQQIETLILLLCYLAWGMHLTEGVLAGETIRTILAKDGLAVSEARPRMREAELLVNGALAPLQLLAASAFVVLAVLGAMAVANLDEALYGWLRAEFEPVDARPTMRAHRN